MIRRRIESELRAWLQVSEDIPLYSDDLFKQSVVDKVNEARQKVQALLEEADKKLDQYNDQLFKLRYEHAELENQYNQADEDYQLYARARSGNEKAAQEIKNRCARLQSLADNCHEANIPFQSCTHIQDEIRKLLNSANLKDRRDQSVLSSIADDFIRREADAKAIRDAIKPRIDTCLNRISSLEKNGKFIQMKRDTALLEVDRGSKLLTELERWEKSYGSSETKESIRQSEKNTKKLTDQIGFAGLKLKLSQAERSHRQKRLDELMNALVQNLFSDDTVGSFDIRDEYFPFQLSVNGGEAYYVLEVLLGDLTCLLDSTDQNTAFPGLLIHDCPREADMSPILYDKLLSLMQQIEQQTYADGAPYQYIVTTTTPPPDRLRELPYLRETLDPSTDDGLLFRRRFKTQRQTSYI